MDLVVRAFPVLEGREEDLRAFIQALQTTFQHEVDAFYRKYGVRRETACLQESAQGKQVIVITEIGTSTPAFSAYSTSEAEFDRWFKAQILHISGIDLNQQPQGPPSEHLFTWTRDTSPCHE